MLKKLMSLLTPFFVTQEQLTQTLERERTKLREELDRYSAVERAQFSVMMMDLQLNSSQEHLEEKRAQLSSISDPVEKSNVAAMIRQAELWQAHLQMVRSDILKEAEYALRVDKQKH